jgi:hypothetical protein
MRVIEAFDEPVRAVTVSPDGRFLAAAGGSEIALLEWPAGEAKLRANCPASARQLAFTLDGSWLVYAYSGGLIRISTTGRIGAPGSGSRASFAGGVAVAPDGRTLAAALAGQRQHVSLVRWELPAWRPAIGFDFWSPFTRLAFSPNGEFLAGIDGDTFELRIAVTGGLNGRHLNRQRGKGYLAFSRDSRSVVFGWGTILHIMETRNGNVIHQVSWAGDDAAFVGNRLLATIDGTPVLGFWSAESWELVREYDWGAGGLTCLAVTADGLACVCGTDAGRLVVFDVDE